MRSELAIVLALSACVPVCEYAELTARYDIELGLCVDRSDTKAEYETCRDSVEEKYREKWDAID